MSLINYLLLLFVLGSFFYSAWWVSKQVKKFFLLDVFWSYSFSLVVIFLSFKNWPPSNNWWLLGMYLFWSLRLGTMLFIRSWSMVNDSRYEVIEAKWGAQKDKRFLFLFLFEGVLTFVLSLPLYFSYHLSDQESGNFFRYLALVWFVLSLSGEIVSDRQLANFKKNSANTTEKEVCQVGFWKYSRHPNYFFEMNVWFSFALFHLGQPWSWINFVPFVIMSYLLCCVTGVPPSEAQGLKSRGEKYRQYQRQTSKIIPWFPKK